VKPSSPLLEHYRRMHAEGADQRVLGASRRARVAGSPALGGLSRCKPGDPARRNGHGAPFWVATFRGGRWRSRETPNRRISGSRLQASVCTARQLHDPGGLVFFRELHHWRRLVLRAGLVIRAPRLQGGPPQKRALTRVKRRISPTAMRPRDDPRTPTFTARGGCQYANVSKRW